MKSVSHRLGPDQFTHCRTDTAGWAAHYVTKAVFEEQDLFDPYADREFLEEAEKLLPGTSRDMWRIDMNAYQEMQDRQQKEFNSFPCFFAFSQEQFDEGMKKLGLKPGDTKLIYRGPRRDVLPEDGRPQPEGDDGPLRPGRRRRPS